MIHPRSLGRLPLSIRWACMAGQARAWRDEDLQRAREAIDESKRCRLIQDARKWHHNAMSYLKMARTYA